MKYLSSGEIKENYKWGKGDAESIMELLLTLNKLRSRIDLYEKTHNKNYVKVVFGE